MLVHYPAQGWAPYLYTHSKSWKRLNKVKLFSPIKNTIKTSGFGKLGGLCPRIESAQLMIHPTSFALVFCLFFQSFSSDVVNVTEQNWNEVMTSPLPVLVKFYAHWCGFSKAFAPIWEQIATNLTPFVVVSRVECSSSAYPVCTNYSIMSYPTMKLFIGGKEYDCPQSPRTVDTFVQHVTEIYPNKVILINNTETLTSFLAADEKLPHILLFSNETKVGLMLKALALIFSGKVVVGQVSSTVKPVVDKYGPIDAYPRLFVLEAEERRTYNGEMTLQALKKFFSQAAAPPICESTMILRELDSLAKEVDSRVRELDTLKRKLISLAERINSQRVPLADRFDKSMTVGNRS